MSTEGLEKKRIVLKGYGRCDDGIVASGNTIIPGHLVDLAPTAGQVQLHGTQGGALVVRVAVENALVGGTVNRDAATPTSVHGTPNNYVAGDQCQFIRPMKGDELNVRLKAGQDITRGDFLISNGDGTVIANGEEDSGVTVDAVLFQAEESLDLTDTGAVDSLLHVSVV